MPESISQYCIEDLLAHPFIEDDVDLQIETAILQTDALDVVDQCEDTVLAVHMHKQSSLNVFNAFLDLWVNIANIWPRLKAFNKTLRDKNVLDIPFTKWVSHYLYENGLLHVSITDGKEYCYRHIRRYVVLPFERVRELWEIDNSKGLILPCDTLSGPYISNNYQLFRAGELYKLMKSEQKDWDDSLSILDNCRAITSLLYYYSAELPFQSIGSNKHDRNVYFRDNPSETHRRADLVVREKKKTNGLMNRKEIRLTRIITGLEKQVERSKKEINRKEKVLQYTLTAHNNLKQQYNQLQQQFHALQQQYNMQIQANNMPYQIQGQFVWNQNNYNMYYQ